MCHSNINRFEECTSKTNLYIKIPQDKKKAAVAKNGLQKPSPCSVYCWKLISEQHAVKIRLWSQCILGCYCFSAIWHFFIADYIEIQQGERHKKNKMNTFNCDCLKGTREKVCYCVCVCTRLCVSDRCSSTRPEAGGNFSLFCGQGDGFSHWLFGFMFTRTFQLLHYTDNQWETPVSPAAWTN